jgi:hypothetical protein
MSKHKQTGVRGRKCTCGKMFVSVMDLNEHINKMENKDKKTEIKTHKLFEDYLD